MVDLLVFVGDDGGGLLGGVEGGADALGASEDAWAPLSYSLRIWVTWPGLQSSWYVLVRQ
ncbi:hypothetical protein [Geodermatophilus amargosae]|uniref:hypothetical protein n=1 Tax=Geodermatophilus amargosae TaxID=1296565 RepID=UPI00158732C0|nr:hypothetical protein [Geodermatophilus amargosae]